MGVVSLSGAPEDSSTQEDRAFPRSAISLKCPRSSSYPRFRDDYVCALGINHLHVLREDDNVFKSVAAVYEAQGVRLLLALSLRGTRG